MRRVASGRLVIGAVALCFASATLAQQTGSETQTPKGWSYDIRNGQRIIRTNRVTRPDGSWREELRQGNCITVRERAATGEYKETRQCNPGKPG